MRDVIGTAPEVEPVPQLTQALVPLQRHLEQVKSCVDRLQGLANRLQGSSPEAKDSTEVGRDHGTSIVENLNRLDYEYNLAVSDLTDLITRLEGIA